MLHDRVLLKNIQRKTTSSWLCYHKENSPEDSEGSLEKNIQNDPTQIHYIMSTLVF